MPGSKPVKPKKKRGLLPRNTEARFLRQERSQGRRVFKRKQWLKSGGTRTYRIYGYGFMKTSLNEVMDRMKIDFKSIVSGVSGTARILDLGCGEGTALKDLRKMFPDTEKVELAGVALNRNPKWTDPSIKWVVSPFYKMLEKFSGKKFDLIYSYVGLEHSSDLKRDSRVVRELLEDNGLLVVTMPRWKMHDEYDEWVPTSLNEFLEQMPGFRLEKHHEFSVRDITHTYKDDSWVLFLRKTPEKKK